MENLNAEQVKSDLEKWLKNFDGKVVDFCTLGNALALINSQEQRIKELAEENERLMRDKASLECIVSTARNQARADTVRKMQERLKRQIFSDATPHDMELLHLFIDGVAKEMLEGASKENAETCVNCGAVIPEGRQICPNCNQ